MSSRVLAKDDHVEIAAIDWERIGHSATPRGLPALRIPGAPAPDETGDLRKKVEELELIRANETDMAQRQGFAQGESHANEKAANALQPVLERMSQSMATLADMRPALRREAELDVVQLAIAIARRVLHRELNVDASALQALVQVALSKIERQETYRVRVHASQVEPVRASLARLGRSAIEVLSDSMCQPGTMVFETNRGQLDASVDTQLEEISRGLADRVRLT